MFCQIPTTNETVQCSFNVCFPPEGLLPFFCSSSFVQFFWRSAAHAFSYIVSLSKCMHVLLFGMSYMFMFKMIAAWSEKRNTISVCAACVNIIHHVLHHLFAWIYRVFFMWKCTTMMCCELAWPVCPWCISKRLKPQDSPHVTYCSTDVVRMSWDFANTVHTNHLLSEHNEFG